MAARRTPSLLQRETFELVVQVNGKVRDRLELPVDLPEDEVVERRWRRRACRRCWTGARCAARWSSRRSSSTSSSRRRARQPSVCFSAEILRCPSARVI